MKDNRKYRTWHRKISMLFLIPLLVVAFSGFVLSLRSYSSLIQPAQQKRMGGVTALQMNHFVEKSKAIPAAGIETWADIKSIEVKPREGVVHVRSRNGFEIQFDGGNGDVLSAQMRYTTWLVRIHEGSIVPDWLWWIVYFPLGPVLIFLALTGAAVYFKLGRKELQK